MIRPLPVGVTEEINRHLERQSDLAVVNYYKEQLLALRNGEHPQFTKNHTNKLRNTKIIRTEYFYGDNKHRYIQGKKHILTGYGEQLLDMVQLCPHFARCYRFDRGHNSKCTNGQGPCKELKLEV